MSWVKIYFTQATSRSIIVYTSIAKPFLQSTYLSKFPPAAPHNPSNKGISSGGRNEQRESKVTDWGDDVSSPSVDTSIYLVPSFPDGNVNVPEPLPDATSPPKSFVKTHL